MQADSILTQKTTIIKTVKGLNSGVISKVG